MSKRYIDADALLKNINENVAKAHNERCAQLLEAILYAPTADVVEVRHGEWGFDGLGWTCSECGEYALTNKSKVQVHSTYCPHCGAKMDGERKDNGT